MSQEGNRAACAFCHNHCRVVIHSENGRYTGFEEDRTDPRGDRLLPAPRGCPRINALGEYLYHPDRIHFPLKKAGEKGEGKWQKISWEQAFDEIAEKLQGLKAKYGPETLGFTKGTNRGAAWSGIRFMSLFGSPNWVGQGQICHGPDIQVNTMVLGWYPGRRSSDSMTKCVLSIGSEPAQSNLSEQRHNKKLQKQGTKLIVVDPRKGETAALADLWLQIRPGTNSALLMSMINVIIKEGLFDKNFVDKWCYGFDKLAERAREYPPDKVAKVTWIAAETIEEAARLFAQNKPAIIKSGMGVEHCSDATSALQAIAILEAITGNIDIPGGLFLSGPGKATQSTELELTEMLSPEQKQKQLGSDRFKLGSWLGYDLISEATKRVWGKTYCQTTSVTNAHAPSLYRAIVTGKPYPVRAVITGWSNPMVTEGNVKLVYQALKKLDLYVVMDYWRTPSAELADYVLPSAPWPERPYLSIEFDAYTANVLGGEQALPSEMPGQYQHKTDYEIMRGLGVRLGQREYWPWEALEETFDYQLKPLGMTHKEFMAQGGYDFPAAKYRKYETIGFGTPTGKVELYSTILEKLGYDPFPYYKESFENPVSTPQVAKEYPLMLITGGRFHPMFHSEHRQIDALRKRHPNPIIQVNPETARKLDIKDGDWVWIETRRGRIRQKCNLFDGIDPRVVHCEHGWWFPELPGEEPWLHGVWESNVNVLTEDDPEVCDQLFGEWPLKTALCKIYKVKQY